MAVSNSARKLRESDYRITPEARPGWDLGTDRDLAVGQTVYCAGGEGTTIALHGKTGDGSRLLQIRLSDGTTQPFFAAASNVLVRPD